MIARIYCIDLFLTNCVSINALNKAFIEGLFEKNLVREISSNILVGTF